MSRQAIESPCVGVCMVDGQDGLCVGCGRSLREIAQWGAMSPEQRGAIMAGLTARLDARSEKRAAAKS